MAEPLVPGEVVSLGHSEDLTAQRRRDVTSAESDSRSPRSGAGSGRPRRSNDVVPEHKKFGILRDLALGQHHQTAEQAAYVQVTETLRDDLEPNM